jgi:phage regulator Rha-like protein
MKCKKVIPTLHYVTLIHMRVEFVKEFQNLKSEQLSIKQLKEIELMVGETIRECD